MRVDIQLAGWRLYVDLGKPKPEQPAQQADQPPTQLQQPMRSVGFYTGGTVESDAAYITNRQAPR